jgi:hypothetical protein
MGGASQVSISSETLQMIGSVGGVKSVGLGYFREVANGCDLNQIIW